MADEDLAVVGDAGAERDPTLAQLAAAAASGLPPAGPEARRRPVVALPPAGPASTRGLCADAASFALDAATRAGAYDARAREALVKYILRPAWQMSISPCAPRGLCASRSSGRSATAPSPSTWIRCRFCVVCPPPCPRPGSVVASSLRSQPCASRRGPALCRRAGPVFVTAARAAWFRGRSSTDQSHSTCRPTATFSFAARNRLATSSSICDTGPDSISELRAVTADCADHWPQVEYLLLWACGSESPTVSSTPYDALAARPPPVPAGADDPTGAANEVVYQSTPVFDSRRKRRVDRGERADRTI